MIIQGDCKRLRPDVSLRNEIDNPIHKCGVIDKIINNENYKKTRKELAFRMKINNPMKNKNIVRKMLKTRRSYKKENNPNWKGGVNYENRKDRRGKKYNIWRKLCMERDDYTCQNLNCPYCNNQKGVYLEVHHIKSFALFPKLRFRVSNGITYCKKYHYQLPKGREISCIK